MNKKYDTLSSLTVGSDNAAVDKESLKAQKQWEKDGTVTEKYLEQTLGDISKGILAIAPHTKKQNKSTKGKSCTS